MAQIRGCAVRQLPLVYNSLSWLRRKSKAVINREYPEYGHGRMLPFDEQVVQAHTGPSTDGIPF